MNIKKFRARTVKEGVSLIRESLGPDAVVLSTKGVINDKGEDEIELLAALDKISPAITSHSAGQAPSLGGNVLPQKVQEVGPLEGLVIPELQELKKSMSELLKWMECSEISNVSPVYHKLISAGITTTNALTIAKEIKKKIIIEGMSDDDCNIVLRKEIAGRVTSTPIQLRKRPVVVALVGPTGTGKTTTIAKLASNFTVFDKLRVALITIDTYRIAAVEQLKTFADILEVPIDVIMSPNEFLPSIKKYDDFDVVFIDTAGRSQKNEEHLYELISFFSLLKPDEIHLVLSLTTKSADLVDVIDKFSIISPDKLIFTKLDETSTFGGIIDAVMKLPIPVSYLTIGQNVPQDIERASSLKIAEYIIR